MLNICIPTYNRVDMTLNSFQKVLGDDRVKNVIIVDDDSDLDLNTYGDLLQRIQQLPESLKIITYRNEKNLDCYMNKRQSLKLSTEQWCILLDSDNEIDKSYIDSLYAEPFWKSDTIYAPEYAKPFDYRKYSGLLITKENVAEYLDKPQFACLLNTCNYFVNREKYLEVFDSSVNPYTADTFYFNYCWLKAGNKIKIVPGLQYEHRIHDGSHYKLNSHKTGNFYSEVKEKLRVLK